MPEIIVSLPSPEHERMSVPLQLFGLAAAPLAWSAATLVAYAFTSYNCFPGINPLTEPLAGRNWVSLLNVVVFFLGILFAAAGGAVAYRAWRTTSAESSGNAVAIEEGRSRYLAVWGMTWSGLFILLLAFNLISHFMVPLCSG